MQTSAKHHRERPLQPLRRRLLLQPVRPLLRAQERQVRVQGVAGADVEGLLGQELLRERRLPEQAQEGEVQLQRLRHRAYWGRSSWWRTRDALDYGWCINCSEIAGCAWAVQRASRPYPVWSCLRSTFSLMVHRAWFQTMSCTNSGNKNLATFQSIRLAKPLPFL